MKISTEEMNQRRIFFTESLRRFELKLIHQYKEIFRELVKISRYPDVIKIIEFVKRRVFAVSLNSVYWTLYLLLDLDLTSTLGQHLGKEQALM